MAEAKRDPDGPADIRMMGIIHEALRRDLRRTKQVLGAGNAAVDQPQPQHQRRAIAGHLGWMMEFLHTHHASEDEGLYPMVRERDPGAAVLLDQMHADHAAIGPAIAAVERSAADFGRDQAAGGPQLLRAVEELEDVLLPHFRREEDEMMPVVAANVTEAEMRRWDDEANIAPKSLRQLGREGHWIIDGLSPGDRELVLHLVPPVPRFVLLHGFARGYRRRSAACWTPTAKSLPRQVQRQGHVEVEVDAAPEAVWQIVRDVTRVGEWSHECVGAAWLGSATSAAVGARFRGRNRSGLIRWGRACEIVDVQPQAPWQIAWRTVSTLLYPDSSEWRITLHPLDGDGDSDGGPRTRIEQSFRVLKVPRLLEKLYTTLIPAHRDRTEALTADLRRLGALAASTKREPAAVADGG